MGLNIKNDETHKLIQELAHLTGESMTTAITEAVRNRLKYIRSQKKTSLATRLLAIGQDCARHLKKPSLSVEHGDLFYGKDGLPG